MTTTEPLAYFIFFVIFVANTFSRQGVKYNFITLTYLWHLGMLFLFISAFKAEWKLYLSTAARTFLYAKKSLVGNF